MLSESLRIYKAGTGVRQCEKIICSQLNDGMKSGHTRRVLTSIVALFIIALGVLTPDIYHITLLIVIGVTIPAILEAWRIFEMQRPSRLLNAVLAFSILAQITMETQRYDLTICTLAGGVMAISIATLMEGYTGSRARLASGLFCLFLIALPLGCLCLIRNVEHGALLVCYLLAVSIFSDSGALYIGSMFGKHKLAPQTSPNKTWEGSIGGSLTAVVAILIWAGINRAFGFGNHGVLWLEPGWHSWAELTIVTLVITVLSQVGDLSESMLKRDAGVKDSGSKNNITGHGGILDMIDAVLWSAPATFIYALFRGLT